MWILAQIANCTSSSVMKWLSVTCHVAGGQVKALDVGMGHWHDMGVAKDCLGPVFRHPPLFAFAPRFQDRPSPYI